MKIESWKKAFCSRDFFAKNIILLQNVSSHFVSLWIYTLIQITTFLQLWFNHIDMRGIEWDDLVNITVVPINVFISCNIIWDGLNLMILAPWAVGSHWSLGQQVVDTWRRHQMETFSALLVLCVGNSSVTGEFLSRRPVPWSFDVLFDREAGDLRCHHAHYDVMVMNKKC